MKGESGKAAPRVEAGSGQETAQDCFVEHYGVTREEIFAHYGFKTEDVDTAGTGHGIWPREKAFEMLAEVKEFVKFLDRKQKISFHFYYDPDFPEALMVHRGGL